MDLVDLMQPLAILSVLVAGYILVFRKPPSQRKNGHYTLPGIFFGDFKTFVIFCYSCLKLIKSKTMTFLFNLCLEL